MLRLIPVSCAARRRTWQQSVSQSVSLQEAESATTASIEFLWYLSGSPRFKITSTLPITDWALFWITFLVPNNFPDLYPCVKAKNVRFCVEENFRHLRQVIFDQLGYDRIGDYRHSASQLVFGGPGQLKPTISKFVLSMYRVNYRVVSTLTHFAFKQYARWVAFSLEAYTGLIKGYKFDSSCAAWFSIRWSKPFRKMLA